MKAIKYISAVSAAAVMAFAGAANAHVSPAGTTIELAGVLTLSQSQTLTCDVSITLQVNAAGTGGTATASLSAGDTGCGWPVQTTGTWSWSDIGPGTIRITGVGANTLFGSCHSGVLDVVWTNGAGAGGRGLGAVSTVGSIPGSTVIPWNPSAPCQASGTVWPVSTVVTVS